MWIRITEKITTKNMEHKLFMHKITIKASNLNMMASRYLGRGAWGGGSVVAMLPSSISSSQSAYSKVSLLPVSLAKVTKPLS